MTADFNRHGISVSTVFGLAGLDENAATAAIGWALSRSAAFQKCLLKDLAPAWRQPRVMRLVVDLQRRADDAGYTDLEIRGRELHVLIEAKVGLQIPSRNQLARYVERLSEAPHRCLVSLSAAPRDYAQSVLPASINGVPVIHRTWREFQRTARLARQSTRSPIERIWLEHLDRHLENYDTMQRLTDNSVYVVSLSGKPVEEGGDYTWIDIVNDGHYFHPPGRGWPTEPPNYIGFRYDGRLQSVHHVESWELIRNLKKFDKRWPREDFEHLVYTLGPEMRPARELKSGRVIWAARVYAAIDLLLSGSCDTISEAVTKTKERLKDV